MQRAKRTCQRIVVLAALIGALGAFGSTASAQVAVIVTRPGQQQPNRDQRRHRRHHGSAVRLGVNVGAVAPVAKTSNALDPGWMAGALLDIRSPRLPVGLRIDGSYMQLPPNTPAGSGSFKLWGGDLNVLLQIPGHLPLRPYAMLGAGGYHVKNEIAPTSTVITGATPAVSSSDNFAVNGGLGLQSNLGPIGAFLEARYLWIFTHGTNTRLIPISFGLSFGGI
jgi:opacity protein-like surface antigen